MAWANGTAELYDMAGDPQQFTNLADAEPDKLAEMIELARTSRVPSEVFPSPFDGA